MPSLAQPHDQNDSLNSRYNALVEGGEIKEDAAQRKILGMLGHLGQQLENPPASASFSLSKLFKPTDEGKPRGIYIWGNVGRGKSMLMGLFYDTVQVGKKRRTHFHAFMQEVHARLHEFRQQMQSDSSNGAGDPVMRLAQALANETSLLCFDEMQASDPADATLLYRLFGGLFDAGVTIVGTSNHPPASLYTGGVQRERFAKFSALLEEKMDVVSLSSPLDYRQVQIRSLEKRYFYPLGTPANAFVQDAILRLTSDSRPVQATLMVQGRKLQFTLYNHSIGYFTFKELCETNLGAADYLALSKRCDTLIVTGIPKLSPEKRNEAKRFVTLIDALYERKVKLLATAEVPPEQIYTEGDGVFEFKRTASRLAEMQSKHWGENLN